MKAFRNILVGTSLSEESDKIVRTAFELARSSGATAHLVHAYVPPSAFGGFPAEYRLDDSEWMDAEKEVLRDKLEAQIRRVSPSGFDRVQGYLEEGAPHRVLARMAGEIKPELIVVGAVEEHIRLLRPLGSTTDRVVRQAACPVLVVRRDSAFPPARVLAPVDLSQASAGALRCGLELLAQARVAPVVETLFVLSPAEASIHFSPDQIAYLAREELKRFAERNLPGVRLERQVRSGMPWEQILFEANEKKADLLVLGTHGHSGLERLLLGSVATDVLREARCSVLIVPPEVSDRAEAEALGARAPESADWSYVSDSVN
jgi:universal stress protein E